MIRVLAAAALLALVVPGPAPAARFAVGVQRGASLDRVATTVARATRAPVSRELAPLRALLVDAPSAGGLAGLPGVAYVERIDRGRRLAFTPTDPLAARQWYLAQVRAFDFWPELPLLPPVRVAVLDSGVDAGHPELTRSIVRSRSFVADRDLIDRHGHGTFVAGEIAAALNNGVGVAGMAFPARLLVAKVVRRDGTITPAAEARAIRWAVDNGARVINLSFGALRDPLDRSQDSFSPLEAAAVAYAFDRGALVVAAVGNGDQAPRLPWPYASYPAALPHVLGVGALDRAGEVPDFSNRDPIFADVIAPGVEMMSTFPRRLTARHPACPNQGYSDCGPDRYRDAEGTSFAAPLVTAAAALVLAVRPTLAPDQLAAVLERSAADATAATGCRLCSAGRDALSGWGALDVTRALEAALAPLPVRDRLETNDDAGGRERRLWGRRVRVHATLDFWDDQVDVYGIKLGKGQRLSATVEGPVGTNTDLVLWKPGTRTVEGLSLRVLRQRATQSAGPGAHERITYRARRSGWFYLQVKLAAPGSGRYTLSFAKR